MTINKFCDERVETRQFADNRWCKPECCGVFGSVGGSYTIVGGGASNSTSLASGMPVQGYVAEGGSAK